MALVECALARILIRENSDQQVIFLQEKGGTRAFPIIIGVFEAIEINRKITGVQTPRPMTHDLVRNVLAGVEARLEKVLINELKDATFFAKLVIRQGEKELLIDSRPSDAIALAVAEKTPIFVDDTVLQEVSGKKEDELI